MAFNSGYNLGIRDGIRATLTEAFMFSFRIKDNKEILNQFFDWLLDIEARAQGMNLVGTNYHHVKWN